MLLPGTRLGPYTIVGLLGVGGMGEVYRAEDSRLGREVAIKVLPPNDGDEKELDRAIDRFRKEARAVAALSHPNIVAIFDFGAEQDVLYAVTELLEGETLRARLSRGPIPPREALAILLDVADGVAAAHARGFIHRDLKPENIFITTSGRVKVLDFGLVRADSRKRTRWRRIPATPPASASSPSASAPTSGEAGRSIPRWRRSPISPASCH